jgi:hypothetical protein
MNFIDNAGGTQSAVGALELLVIQNLTAGNFLGFRYVRALMEG